jgi:hypothetical protein
MKKAGTHNSARSSASTSISPVPRISSVASSTFGLLGPAAAAAAVALPPRTLLRLACRSRMSASFFRSASLSPPSFAARASSRARFSASKSRPCAGIANPGRPSARRAPSFVFHQRYSRSRRSNIVRPCSPRGARASMRARNSESSAAVRGDDVRMSTVSVPGGGAVSHAISGETKRT